MGTLRVWLFGALRLDHEDFRDRPHGGASGAGVAGLSPAAPGAPAQPEVLAGIFWGDRSDGKARRCLNTAVWRLRNALEPEGVAARCVSDQHSRRRAGFQLCQRPLAGRGRLRGAGAPGAGLPGR